jgi:predicted enzyme related to lactoylglutathione lyase
MAVPQGDLRLLESDVAQDLLASALPARVAYVAHDGTPRVVPTWFHWNGRELVMPTFVAAPHVRRPAARLRDLRANPDVAISIDTLTRRSRPALRAGRSDGPIVSSLVEWRLELVAIPVSDVDRAKAFYTEKVGFNADHDHQVSDELRFVQLTPHGSACSIALGTGITEAEPGSVQGMQMVVPDIEAARAELVERGVDVSETQHFPWGSFVFFSDPDGNGWAVQQIPPRD